MTRFGITAHAIEIEPATLGVRGQRYRVTYLGEVLIEGTRNPEFDACRALLAHGITGTLEVWRPGGVAADMRLNIERGAKLTISETDDRGLRPVRWEPFSSDQVSSVVLSGRVEPRTAGRELVATSA
jgi:hypothetical protein